MDLKELRGQMDAVDDQLTELFVRRMDISAAISEYKAAHDLPVRDPAREEAKLLDVCAKVPERYASYVRRLYEGLFALSRDYQHSLRGETQRE